MLGRMGSAKAALLSSQTTQAREVPRWLPPAKAGGVSRWPARYIRRCRRTGSHPRVSHLWSTSMTRYNIEETAVYDKYVRWCGRTGPRGPSYPIRANGHNQWSASKLNKFPKTVKHPRRGSHVARADHDDTQERVP